MKKMNFTQMWLCAVACVGLVGCAVGCGVDRAVDTDHVSQASDPITTADWAPECPTSTDGGTAKSYCVGNTRVGCEWTEVGTTFYYSSENQQVFYPVYGWKPFREDCKSYQSCTTVDEDTATCECHSGCYTSNSTSYWIKCSGEAAAMKECLPTETCVDDGGTLTCVAAPVVMQDPVSVPDASVP